MATLKELRDERLRKLEDLRASGVQAYPSQTKRTHDLSEISNQFDDLEGHTVTVVGRIMSTRKFGKLAFIVIRDLSGRLQLFLQANNLTERDPDDAASVDMTQLNLLDPGDFVEATGEVIRTKTGEISVSVRSLRILSKSLRGLPTELDGFTNKEERLRRRYVDMNVNLEVRDRFIRRSKFWQATRQFLDSQGFYEINIPVLEHTTGGADANPFVTHMDALDQDLYLRISHELPLKRLLGAGFEKVYDIGPRFRNENYSDEHLPEHVAMEWYWAYANWQDGMKFMEEMYRFVLEKTFGKLQFDFQGQTVDMASQWQVWDYATVIKDNYGIDVFNVTLEEVSAQLEQHNLEVEKTDSIPRAIDKLWKNIRRNVVGPVWLVNTPKFISPLSKSSADNPDVVERFQPIVMGSELGNGFSELNDPQEQYQRFLEQQKLREAGDTEAMMMDIDYIEMLEYGMPPACGWGYSERVFWSFEGVSAREGVPFPQMRLEFDQNTREIYKQANL